MRRWLDNEFSHNNFFLLQPRTYTNYGQYYGQNLTQSTYGNLNQGYTTNTFQHRQQQQQPSSPAQFTQKSIESLYNPESGDPNRRFAVHVRNSPISPASSQFSNGISVKNAGGGSSYYPSSSTLPPQSSFAGNNNVSFDYVPASAFCKNPSPTESSYNVDNYSVYVNGPPKSSYAGHHHEVVVPAVHKVAVSTSSGTNSANSSSSSGGSGSLATHVWFMRASTTFLPTQFERTRALQRAAIMWTIPLSCERASKVFLHWSSQCGGWATSSQSCNKHT